MMPREVVEIARVETLAQDLDYEVPFTFESSSDDVGRLLDELQEYVEDSELSEAEGEEILRRIEQLREAFEDL